MAATTSLSPGGWYKAVIPADAAVAGKSLHYYLEARDAAGEVVGNAGRDDSPNLVLVRDGAPSLGKGLYAGMSGPRREDGEEDGDGRGAGGGRPAEGGGPAEGSASGRPRASTGGTPGRAVPRAVAGQRLRLAPEREAGVLRRRHHRGRAGSRAACSTCCPRWATSSPTGRRSRSRRGCRSSPSRARVTPSRGPRPRGRSRCSARLQYFLGGGNLQGSLSAYAGGGSGFRLTIGPQPDTQYLRNDSVRGGPLVAGAGLGFIYHFSPRFGFVFDAKGLHGLARQRHRPSCSTASAAARSVLSSRLLQQAPALRWRWPGAVPGAAAVRAVIRPGRGCSAGAAAPPPVRGAAGATRCVPAIRSAWARIGRPARASHSRAPAANRSVRSEAGAPRSRSGAR